MKTLWHGARTRLAASIGARIGAVMLAVTLGFLLLTGSGNLAYIAHLTRQAADDALSAHANDVARDFETLLASVGDDSRVLANNPTVVSAVLDARNQESYLHPLLSRFRPQGRTPETLCVTDYRGRTLGCAGARHAENAVQPWLNDAIAANLPAAHVAVKAPNRAVLYLAYPVTYEGTGSAEGAVVSSYDLSALLFQSVAERHKGLHIHLRDARQDLYASGPHDGIVHVGGPLHPLPPLDDLQLQLRLGIHESVLNEPVLRLLAAYSLLGLILVAGVLWAIRLVVPPLISRLATISEEAKRIADGDKTSFDATTPGTDEIAQLGRAFATMTHRLGEINQSLETQVDERTHELREQQALLGSIVDAVPGAIFQLRRHADGRFSMPFFSRRLREIYDLEDADLKSDAAPVFARVHGADLAAFLDSLAASAQKLDAWHHDFRIVVPGRPTAWLQGTGLPRSEADGSTLWHGILADITDHKRAEIALADSEAYSKALFEHSYNPLVIMDPDTGRFIDCNDAAVAIYRLGDRSRVIGLTPDAVSAPAQYDGTPSATAAREHVAAARRQGLHIFEWRHRRPDGELWDGEVRLMGFRVGEKDLLQFSLRDITEQKRTAAEIWRQANFDTLTGLANRNLCGDRLQRALALARRNARKVGVLYVDLDGFKVINDTFGHATGDRLLVEVAGRLEGCIRAQDTVARFGGDEFVVVVSELAARDDLHRVGEEIVGLLHQPFTLGGESRQISASVGIAVFPDDAESADELLRLADQALYRSKSAGKNRYAFHA